MALCVQCYSDLLLYGEPVSLLAFVLSESLYDVSLYPRYYEIWSVIGASCIFYSTCLALWHLLMIIIIIMLIAGIESDHTASPLTLSTAPRWLPSSHPFYRRDNGATKIKVLQ